MTSSLDAWDGVGDPLESGGDGDDLHDGAAQPLNVVVPVQNSSTPSTVNTNINNRIFLINNYAIYIWVPNSWYIHLCYLSCERALRYQLFGTVRYTNLNVKLFKLSIEYTLFNVVNFQSLGRGHNTKQYPTMLDILCPSHPSLMKKLVQIDIFYFEQ